MCLYPKLINNPKYKANKKNGGNVPTVPDERVKYVPIGCQNCIECRKKKQRDWQVRLQEEIKTNTNGHFITLTFNNESITELSELHKDIEGYNLDNQIATTATRRFLERWRKRYKKSLRHWLVTELGHNGTENIHMHGIIWTNDITQLQAIWQYGYVWSGNNNEKTYINAKTVNYITKYITKTDKAHPNYKSIILTSAGIGNQYTNQKIGDWQKNQYKEGKKETNETYRTTQGSPIALPIYYRNKIYSEEQREKLWLNKLDKQERYVLGTKISVKDNEEAYNAALAKAQQLNIELGYGTDTKDWNQEQYELQKRQIKNAERKTKAMQKETQNNNTK